MPTCPPEQWRPILRDLVEVWVVEQGRGYPEVLRLARLATERHCQPTPPAEAVDRRVAEWVVDLSVAGLLRQQGARR